MLDTDQLRSFLAIVDTGSFTKAAERVNKTQSAVSMQIRRLEEQLGRALFVKNGRGVKISHDGETLVDYARQILRLEASALSAVSDRGLNGRVLLGMPDDYAEWLLPEILKQFSLTYPAVELSIICDSSVAMLDRVARREVDLAVITSNVTTQDKVEPLVEEPLTFVGSRRAAPFDQRPLPLALDGPSCCWRTSALEALDEAGIDYRLIVVSRSRAAIIPVVDAGLALTVLPRAALGPDARAFGPEDGLPALPAARIGMLHSTAARSREVQALADVIRLVGTRIRNGATSATGNVVPLPVAGAVPDREEGVSGHRPRARA